METRIRIWALMAVVALTAGGVAYAERPATAPDRAPKPRVVEHRPAPAAPVHRHPAFTV